LASLSIAVFVLSTCLSELAAAFLMDAPTADTTAAVDPAAVDPAAVENPYAYIDEKYKLAHEQINLARNLSFDLMLRYLKTLQEQETRANALQLEIGKYAEVLQQEQDKCAKALKQEQRKCADALQERDKCANALQEDQVKCVEALKREQDKHADALKREQDKHAGTLWQERCKYTELYQSIRVLEEERKVCDQETSVLKAHISRLQMELHALREPVPTPLGVFHDSTGAEQAQSAHLDEQRGAHGVKEEKAEPPEETIPQSSSRPKKRSRGAEKRGTRRARRKLVDSP
jgi:hypothetical protein